MNQKELTEMVAWARNSWDKKKWKCEDFMGMKCFSSLCLVWMPFIPHTIGGPVFIIYRLLCEAFPQGNRRN